jgi:hypothetical protein
MIKKGTLRAAFGLLVLAGTLVGGRPLDASAVGGVNTVMVGPGHGKAAAAFHVTYTVSPCPGLGMASLTIGFSWGALPAAGQVLGTAGTDSACRATLSTKPPVNAVAGSYQVFGYVALPTGTPTPGTEASAGYTIDVTPTPAPTASSSAVSKPSASAPGKPAASTPASAPAASSQPSATGAVPAGNVVVAKGTSQPGWWALAWQVLLGGTGVALLLLVALAFLIAWLGRRRRARADADRRNDRAA